MARPKKETTGNQEMEQSVDVEQKQPAKPAKQEKPHPYKEFEKWLVNVTAIQVPDNAAESQYKMLFVKKLRDDIQISEKNAKDLNTQTHNNSVRYVLAGSVTNGDEQVITVSRQKSR